MNPMQRIVIAACLCTAIVPAQQHKDLARAELLERQEGDLAAAEQAYRALLSGDAAIAAEASLRLGQLLWRLDRKDEARAALVRAVAAGGDVAAAANALLQGQGDEAKQAQERLVRARAIVAELRKKAGQENVQNSDAASELRWLGSSGAQALVEAIEDGLRRDPEGPPNSPWAGLLVPMLWQIGTPPAAEFLLRIAKDPHVGWRRLVATHANGFAADLRPVFVALLDDPDPAGEVQRCLERFTGYLPTSSLVKMLQGPSPNVRVGGMQGLAWQWRELAAADREAAMPAVTAAVRTGITSAEPRLQQATLSMLSLLAEKGPRSARHLVLELGDQLPADFTCNVPSNDLWQLDDDDVHLLAAIARRFRTATDARQRNSGRMAKWITALTAQHVPQWTRAGIDDLLELIESGFLTKGDSYVPWAERLVGLASDAQLLRLLRALPAVGQPGMFVGLLQKRESLPAGTWDALHEVLESVLHTPPDAWNANAARYGTGIGNDLQQLLYLVGRTRADGAPEYLLHTLAPMGNTVNLVAQTIVQLSASGVGEPASAALRTLLVWDGIADNALDPSVRYEVLAELARRGDEPTIALLPRAVALGLSRQNGAVLILLTDWTRDGRRWNAYTPAQLRAAWSALLDGAPATGLWAEVGKLEDGVPLAALDLVLARYPSIPEAARNSNVFRPLSGIPAAELAANSPLHTAVRTILTGDDSRLALVLFVHLRSDAAALFATEAHAALARSEFPSSLLPAMRKAGIEITPDEWARAFASNDPQSALRALPETLTPELLAIAEDLVRHGRDAGFRSDACTALATRVGTRAVPALLDALRDPDEGVRKAATDALAQLRFHQEQQTWWQNTAAGIDVSKPSATAKLVRQASPDTADKAQRLLAIRSLAAVGAAEALPYLIDWTRDRDTDVAAAALAAAQALLDRSAPATGK